MRGTPQHFSVGALAGAVFAGLWIGGGAMQAVSEFVQGPPPHDLFGWVIVALSALTYSLIGSIFLFVPAFGICLALAYPLAVVAAGNLTPSRRNSIAVGVVMGVVIGLCMTLFNRQLDELLAGDRLDLLLATAGICGGAGGGLTYRALLKYIASGPGFPDGRSAGGESPDSSVED